ncbi:MAG: class I SAM-dependent methyltransferase, partial [Crocinitomicaceae bacterium]
YKDQIKCIIGDAMEIIPGLKREFDIVFIDADKSNYLNYYNMIINKVRKGGYIILDNVLWSGKVLEEVEEEDLDTKVLIELNTVIHNDDRVEEVLLPIRDGLMIARVK